MMTQRVEIRVPGRRVKREGIICIHTYILNIYTYIYFLLYSRK